MLGKRELIGVFILSWFNEENNFKTHNVLIPLDLYRECCYDGDIQNKLGSPQSRILLRHRITSETVNGRITHLHSRIPVGNWDANLIQSKHGDSQWKEL